ncbi:MAG TPA: AbrB/MazE/SpoVT family DNA-binding domain-containing protein [Tepidisphaeraceae bacterium]|jgi:antitoxin component of MazEF toxin-antitoxin module|nr:AbrB/MazE/SpoVT family DNA-binding domain-containing protein [Tepidisphaeraceae bacterium]
MTVIVKKLGGSVAILIPKAVAREMDLVEGTPLDMRTDGRAIVLGKKTRRPRRPLKQIVAQIKPASYRRRSSEPMDDRAVGREIW